MADETCSWHVGLMVQAIQIFHVQSLAGHDIIAEYVFCQRLKNNCLQRKSSGMSTST